MPLKYGLGNYDLGNSRSLTITPLVRSCTNSYHSVVVTRLHLCLASFSNCLTLKRKQEYPPPMDQHDKPTPPLLGHGARFSVEHGAMSSVGHRLRAAVGHGAMFTVAQGHPRGPIKGSLKSSHIETIALNAFQATDNRTNERREGYRQRVKRHPP